MRRSCEILNFCPALVLLVCSLSTSLQHRPLGPFAQDRSPKSSLALRKRCFISGVSIPWHGSPVFADQPTGCKLPRQSSLAPRSFRHRYSPKKPAGSAVMLSREAVCGLWTLKYNVEDEQREATVWLEAAGNMRPLDVDKETGKGSFGSLRPSAGRWSMKKSTVMLYYRKPGLGGLSWAGKLVEQSSSGAPANVSRAITGGVIQQGDSDPEFLGRFEAVQKLPAFTAEELIALELGKQRTMIPRFSMEDVAGQWALQGKLYDEPVILNPVTLHPDGQFEAVPDATHRFAGRWGLYRDGPEEELQENREQPSQQKGSRREGTHFWLWAQRSECAGFNMNADYRFVGRMEPAGLEDQLQLSVAKKAAENMAEEGARVGQRMGSEFPAPRSMQIQIQGSIFWGNIADMEYSDLAGNFDMRPLSKDAAADEDGGGTDAQAL